MPDPGKYQLQTTGGDRICEIVSCAETLERTKIATKLYGGGYLMQTVGFPTRILNLRLRAWNNTERDAVNTIESGCGVIVAKLDETTETGYILDAPNLSIIVDGMIYEANVKYVVISE